jgi:6-pyruvoyltetrahydropterin/6-carboxytetrahydropterin synthase
MFTLELAKEDFKFSSAHFTLFGAECGEQLHGHNYQVAVRLAGHELDDLELLVDLASLKERIRELCAGLDSRTLLPARSPHLRVRAAGGEVEVRFESRRYLFPEPDTRLLPLRNISVESLARFLWESLASILSAGDTSRLARLGLAVQETAGQRCWFEAALPRSGVRGKRRARRPVDSSARREEAPR